MKKPTKLPKLIDRNPDQSVAEYAAKLEKEGKPAAAAGTASAPASKPAGVPAKDVPAARPAVKIHTTTRIEQSLAAFKKANKGKKKKTARTEDKQNGESKSSPVGSGPAAGPGRDRPAPGRPGGSDGRPRGRVRLPIDWFRLDL